MFEEKIIKRLELIKSLISLEEENEIVIQVSKLQALEPNENLKKIIAHLQSKAFGKAIVAIDIFINQHDKIALYIDPQIEALRFEAKAIVLQIQQLSNEKAELEKLIHEFGVRHNQELGELILKILQYRKEKHKNSPKEEETQKDYEDFHSNYEATKDESIITLSDEDKKILKDNYRKASKLCHPDVVTEEQKEEAHIIFTELYAAYERNNLKRVSEILENLIQDKIFTSNTDITSEKATLNSEVERLRVRLNVLYQEIDTIKKSDTFDKISTIKDWDEYFVKTKQQLEEQLRQFENGGK